MGVAGRGPGGAASPARGTGGGHSLSCTFGREAAAHWCPPGDRPSSGPCLSLGSQRVGQRGVRKSCSQRARPACGGWSREGEGPHGLTQSPCPRLTLHPVGGTQGGLRPAGALPVRGGAHHADTHAARPPARGAHTRTQASASPAHSRTLSPGASLVRSLLLSDLMVYLLMCLFPSSSRESAAH